jgi:hypothetical protein
MRRLVPIFLVLIALPAIAKSRAVRHPTAWPTFDNEVVRIFQEHCQTCHHAGDIAPFSLTSYEEAKPYATLIKLMTKSHQMPPWKPTDGCGEFANERTLSKEEIDTLGQWVDHGAPEGDAWDLPQLGARTAGPGALESGAVSAAGRGGHVPLLLAPDEF